MPGSWGLGGIIMPCGIMPGPMLGALGEGICGGIPWERGWDPIGFMPSGLRADIGPGFPGPIIRGLPWWFIAMPARDTQTGQAMVTLGFHNVNPDQFIGRIQIEQL